MKIQSFTERALDYIVDGHLFEATNWGQSGVTIYLGLPIRVAARLIYGIAAITVIPAVGALYHSIKAIQCAIAYGVEDKIAERNKAWQYLKAAGLDGTVATVNISAIAVIPFVLVVYVA